MDESDFQQEKSGQDSSVMRSGIPKHMDKVEPLQDDSADLVYRNVDVMSTSSVRRAGAGVDGMALMGASVSMAMDRKAELATEPTVFRQVPTVFAKPSIAVLPGKYQLLFTEAGPQVVHRIGVFLTAQSITHTHRMESSSNCWDCYTISQQCQLVKFEIQTFPRPDGVLVNFKRDRGCCDAMSHTFAEFQKANEGVAVSAAPVQKGRFRMQPPPLPTDFEEDDLSSCTEMEQALVAMSQWLQSSPVEALQAIGQLFSNKCKHLLRSENLLSDVCKAVQRSSDDGADIIILALSLSCLRRIISVHKEVGSECPLAAEAVSGVQRAVSRAHAGKDLTARREADLAMQAVNSIVSVADKILNM